MISNGVNVNMQNDAAVDRDGSILDYCRLNDITIQPWSPFQYGFFKGVYLDNPDFPELNAKINEIGKKYGVTNNAVVIAWILRHPAKMQPITGTMNAGRLKEIFAASDITLTREDWYEIYRAAGNILP
jgi:predicted oxidoreductase